ncbi:metallophosphoesterase family protein [bacterium]|nr:metallophosphoesterase family protein [bacterium]
MTQAGTLLLNPGSVYANWDRPERTCAILTLPACDLPCTILIRGGG